MKKELVLILQSVRTKSLSNNIEEIGQLNIATVGDDTAQSNFVGTSQDLQTVNVCDETGLGDNVAHVNNSSENFIGPVGQTNDADGAGDADFTQNNNIPTINQVIDAQNDCDQSDEQADDGNNEAICGNAVEISLTI